MANTLRRRPRSSWMTPFDLLREDAWPGLTPWPDDASGQPLTGVYPVDVREDDEHLYVEAELPGFQKNEIDVNLEGGVLSISAERTPEEFTGTRHLDERRYTRVQRSFALPTSVDDSDVDAKFEDGLLKLTLDKKPESRRRKITVK